MRILDEMIDRQKLIRIMDLSERMYLVRDRKKHDKLHIVSLVGLTGRGSFDSRFHVKIWKTIFHIYFLRCPILEYMACARDI